MKLYFIKYYNVDTNTSFEIGVFDEEHIDGVLYILNNEYGSKNIFYQEININKTMY